MPNSTGMLLCFVSPILCNYLCFSLVVNYFHHCFCYRNKLILILILISLYLFCVYMLVDCNDVSNLQEFENIISEISMICLNNNAEYVCIAGDMNTDLSRTNSWHTKSVL